MGKLRKLENILKGNLKRKTKFTQSLLIIFLMTGGISFAEEKVTNINITNVNEQTGLELGDNSRARGTGSIATGRNSIAIGKNAVATGDNENKETIERKLAENREKLTEIENAKQLLNNKQNELALKQVKERETIEAGIRVEEIRKAKEKAKVDWQNKLQEYNNLKNSSQAFLDEHKAKIDNLNSKLAGISNITGYDIKTEAGLNDMAQAFKTQIEQGTTLNLSLDFYKDYIGSYYKALGDLTKAKNVYQTGKNTRHNAIVDKDGKIIQKNKINSIDYSGYLSTGIQTYSTNDKYIYFSSSGNGVHILNEERLNVYAIDTVTKTKEEYERAKTFLNNLKNETKNIIKNSKDVFLTEEIKEQYYKKLDAKLGYDEKVYEIAYYQYEYDKTQNTTWLDKKKQALAVANELKKEHEKYSDLYTLRNKQIEVYGKANITDVEEKNKITTETLTSELEKALNINKNAILEKEKEIESKKKIAEQAEKNYQGLNPTEADLILAREYERIKAEINTLSNEIVQADERLKALKAALTLNDLSNIGENQIAQGSNTLAVGNNAIAIGTTATTIGENSISLGKETLTTGKNSVTIGTSSITIGNNNVSLGNNNKIGTVNTQKDNVFILGSNVDATNVENAIALGNNSKAVSNAVSIGSEGAERQIKFVKDGEISNTSKDAINGSQLKTVIDTVNSKVSSTELNNYVKLDATNIDATAKTSLTTKLSEGANLTNPTNSLITDTIVKSGLDSKLDKTDFTAEAINKKIKKGNINSSDLTISGAGKILDEDLTLNIKNGSITNEKLSTEVKNSINSKADKSSVYNKTETYTKEEVNNLVSGKVSTNDLNNALSNYVKLDGSNIDSNAKTNLTTKLTEGASLENPTNSLVTDTLVKAGLDKKVDKTTYAIDKAALENAINSKANATDLANKANVDATNIDVNKYTEKLSKDSNLNNPNDKLITDKKVKDYLTSNYYTNTEIDKKISNVNVKTEADIVSNTLEVKNGEKRLIGDKNVSIEVKDGAISKGKLDNNLKSEINNKANINGNNIISSKDKADFRKNIEVYSKTEIENKLSNLTVNADLTGEITATEEKGVKGKVIHNHLVKNYISKAEMTQRDGIIINNYNEINRNKIAIAENTRRIEQVEKKINKTAALSTAMASIEYPKIGVGEVAVGAGISGFGGEQGVAVGTMYSPTENLILGLKYAGLVDNRYRGAVSGSIGYKFRLHN